MKKSGFVRILLATDGSEQAQAATEATASFARTSGAAVRVFHVSDVAEHAEADRLINEAIKRLRLSGIDADGELGRADQSHVAVAVAEAAREFDADLVVVGSRGLSDWQSLTRHGVSHNVLCAVDCPVLVVRGKSGPAWFEPPRVLLAIAGGDDVATGVRAAIAAAAPPDSRVRVLHVAQAIFGAQGYAYVEPVEEINATIDAATAMLRDAGLESDAVVAEAGPVARVVAQAAADWKADVIVMGSSRMRDLPGMLFGSVTHDLLRVTQTPVLVAERARE
jgi:nucleotide-binding universal stress UspA family protein